MPRAVDVLSVFTASPRDVALERKALERVVEELNRVWSPQFRVQIELLKWETHVTPSVGSDAQAIVNDQIADRYDVFLGIFWTRIGSATPRADSGTIEEFERAYRRWQKDPSSIEIMVYFKDEPISPTLVDPNQLSCLNDFKARLESLGVLYRPFKTSDEFVDLARLHLSKLVGQIAKRSTAGVDSIVAIRKAEEGLSPSTVSDNADIADPDIGYLDLEEIFASEVESLVATIGGFANETIEFTTSIHQRALEISSAPNQQAAKNHFAAAANNIDSYATHLEQHLPRLRDSQLRVSISCARMITLREASHALPQTDLQQLATAIENLIRNYRFARETILELRQTAAATPRATRDINKATRRLVQALDSLLEELATGERLMSAVVTQPRGTKPA
jgi:hypothetical protein